MVKHTVEHIEKIKESMNSEKTLKKMRKYNVNENFFETWSDDMTYILGFLYADGNLDSDKDSYIVTLRLKESDREHLVKIVRCMSRDLPVRKETTKLNGKSYFNYVVYIDRKKIYNDLLKLGLHSNKTFTIRFPDIPKEYVRHFIRGYFDGDGCMGCNSMSKNPRGWTFDICSGSKQFIFDLQGVFMKNLNLNGRIYFDGSMYILIISKQEYLKQIYHFFYNNANLYLQRKKDKFGEFMKIMEPIEIELEVK
ncbi:hypothetical protein CMI37_09340 [Candidatus Pacearchaeota archaeon]|nr:hypothetical protein [Candidatus Pacearchaeota archaeon]|tara:strand:- start:829 stop:1584 length:756 start_codon:yes stop_codon:yes gene_type:complete